VRIKTHGGGGHKILMNFDCGVQILIIDMDMADWTIIKKYLRFFDKDKSNDDMDLTNQL